MKPFDDEMQQDFERNSGAEQRERRSFNPNFTADNHLKRAPRRRVGDTRVPVGEQNGGYNRGYNNDGGYNNRGYNNDGGYNNNRGGYYNNNRGGYGDNGYNGGYNRDNNGEGGYNNNRGGGYNNNRGGYNNNRGGG